MGTKYGSFAVGDANIDNVMLNLAGINTGYSALTLTNMTSTAVPQIAAGSKIEVGGSLFKFDSAETITGSATTGTNYIRLVPSGSSITAEWTTTAPTWSDSKQGWYDGTGAKRYWQGSVSKLYASYYKANRNTRFNIDTPVYFCASKLASQTTASGGIITFPHLIYDPFGTYSTSTSIFTIPFSGVYSFLAQAVTTSSVATVIAIARKDIGGTEVETTYFSAYPSNTHYHIVANMSMLCTAGDTVSILGGAGTYEGQTTLNELAYQFSGVLIK